MNEGCNGICVRAYEILPGYGSEIAIPHPDCEVHGKPAAEVRSTATTAQTVQGRPVGGDPSFGQKITLTADETKETK